MSWILFLDDMRDPSPQLEAVLARSVEQALALIEKDGPPAFVHFDHDLGHKEPTGFDFAKMLVERDMDAGGSFLPPGFDYRVHSSNPPGAANIKGLLDGYLGAKREARASRSPGGKPS